MLTFLIILIAVLLALFLFVYIFIQQSSFGKKPEGERLKKILASPHFQNGQFRNQSPTPSFTEGSNMAVVMKDFFFGKDARSIPSSSLPSQKTDLHQLGANEDVLVWFGHSSYFIQVHGKRILVDPVFSGHASPVNFTTRSFKGSDVYKAGEMPAIDLLIITHDHWDHLDHQTMIQLRPRVKNIITGLGVGAHLERWGYDQNRIIELDWNEQVNCCDGFMITSVPARHFSGRGLKRNGSLWSSFALRTQGYNIFIGGDSGYDHHFKKAGMELGPFDLAILETGQYNRYWKYIHMMPEEVVQAAVDLKARSLLPVHWSKFSLSLHAWDEPVIKLLESAKDKDLAVLHPMIGEKVYLDKQGTWQKWWQGI